MFVFSACAILALVTSGALGWLLAARRDREVRQTLAVQLGQVRETNTALQGSLTEVRGAVAAAEFTAARASKAKDEANDQLSACTRELAAMRTQLATRSVELAATRVQITESSDELGAARSRLATRSNDLTTLRAQLATRTDDLATLRTQLAAQTHDLAEMRALVDSQQGKRAIEEVQRVLAPLLDRERLIAELARIDVGAGPRGELPEVMDTLARVGGFSSVVLSDDIGLPIAVNSGAEDGEKIAGMWSMLLTVADRVVLSGEPAAQSVVVHDAANQTLLHRLFSSGGNRFLLTAISRGRTLSPDVLDPALGKLERILA